MKLLETSAAGVLAFTIAACNTAGVKSYESAATVAATSTQDKRVWLQADEFDEQLHHQGPVYSAPELTQYLNDVALKLYPEFEGKIRIFVLQHPSFNAFALPNGSIYMHTGLLAKLENEAELAVVLAHEIAHFVHRHGLKQTNNIKVMSAISLGVAVATGIPMLAEVLAASSVYGYSRDLEREADREGYDRLISKGYDANQASRVFEKMLAEIKALDIDEPVFFSSHPKLQERIDSFNALAEKQKTRGILNQKIYKEKIAPLYALNLQDELEHQQYKKVIYWLEHSNSPYQQVNTYNFYLAEAYMLRADEGDEEKALNHYKQCLLKKPDFAPAYQALGKYHYQRNEFSEAREYFTRYLELHPNATDRGYVHQYLNKMDT